MTRWDDSFRRVMELNRTVRPAEAERLMEDVLRGCTPDELRALEPQIGQVIASFLRKRQKSLTQLFDEVRRQPPPPAVKAPPVIAVAAPRRAVDEDVVAYSRRRLLRDLTQLAEHHIFQWTTFYREILNGYFEDFLYQLATTDQPAPWLAVMKTAIGQHASTIFQRGYWYQIRGSAPNTRQAIAKSLAGLQRFLDLTLEFYSARLPEAHQARRAAPLRQLCSAMLSGILIGYSTVVFTYRGSKVLAESPAAWIDTMPFLTAEHLREVLLHVEPGWLTVGLQESALPLARVVDVLMRREPTVAPLPALSLYSRGNARLEVTFQLSAKSLRARRVEIHCYLAATSIDRQVIEEAATRAISAVVAPLGASLRAEIRQAPHLAEIVVHTGSPDDAPHARILELLAEWAHDTGFASPNHVIGRNYAAAFPLDQPRLTRYTHVDRWSVRRLLESFELRNGVRLWCSVRRSGKTTACESDLGSPSGQSIITTQTCDRTSDLEDDTFYRAICDALTSEARLSEDFVARTVAECLPAPTDRRVVLVLDEYETLFGHLAISMNQDPRLRYTVVQPLLNQLVSFTRENLLILVGQQPNAHWILPDQNQLSPLVTQDPFPLFSHEPASNLVDEFHELVLKIMTSNVDVHPEFVDCVYRETGGHPFLTGKLLVSFCEWLIETRRPQSSLQPVRPELFDEFVRSNLDHTSIIRNQHYVMFRQVAADHLSDLTRAHYPWLHAVYSGLRGLVLNSPTTFALPVAEFTDLIRRHCDDISVEELLATATRANFLTNEDGMVRPRIRLLARIAAAVRCG
ncbi:hypothetical protein [Kutzneria sp. NPDC052558]|uniref:hypothetical protein n=1 Tax=Kutzneria sp. NPDC052558 TaxID=3364121 RepID=UPI0037C84CEE